MMYSMFLYSGGTYIVSYIKKCSANPADFRITSMIVDSFIKKPKFVASSSFLLVVTNAMNVQGPGTDHRL